MVLSGIAWLVAGVAGFRLLRAVAHVTLVRTGLCRYHSPLLYTTGVGRRRGIHLGTSRDFLGCQGHRRVRLARLAEGLLALCDDVERGRLAPEVRLTGITDLLRDETARRLGFRASPPGPLGLAITLTAWAQVSLLRTLLRREPSLVRVGRLRQLQVVAGDLVERRAEIERLRDRLV